MKKIKHTITRKSIPHVELISTTSQNWFDYNNNLVPWSGNTGYIPTGLTPYDGYVVYNTTGSLSVGYYKYSGSTWNHITGTNSYINSQIYKDHQLPIYLDAKVDEYGAMVSFDGNIAVESQLVPVNFIYFLDCDTIEIVDTTNYGAFRDVQDFYFTIYWGDGTTTVVNVGDTNPIIHTYSDDGEKTVLVEWTTPYSTYTNISNVVCEFCFRITQENHLIDGVTTSYIKTEQEINPGNFDYLKAEQQ